MRSFWNAIVAVLVLVVVLVTSADAQERTPFTGVRFPTSESVEVEVLGTWWGLVAIEEIEVGVLLKHARANHGEKWQKRIGEDLVQLFAELGGRLPQQVDLKVRNLGDDSELTLEDVPATTQNRRRAWMRNERGEDRSPGEDFELEPEAWQKDLRHVQELLETKFAYLGLRAVTPYEEVEAVIHDHGDRPMARADLARRLGVLLAKFGDGHSGVMEEREFLVEGYAPFLLREAEGGPVAFLPDRSGFVEPEHPYLEAIDGVRLEQWLDVAERHVAAGSAQLVRRRSLERLRWIQDVRREAGFAEADTLTLTLRDAKGARKQKQVRVADRRPTFGTWPKAMSELREDGVGYLRIEEMVRNDAYVDVLIRRLEEFSACDAVVIDVRGNGGGTRDILLALAPFFLGTKNPPVVANVAKAVLWPGQVDAPDVGWLADRFCWPAQWSQKGPGIQDGWSPGDKKAIRRFAKKFRPLGALRSSLSVPHYLVLERHPTDRRFVYEGVVLVLQDAGCFSATDVFLAGMKELPGVLTVGTASSGGSARSHGHRLPESGLTVRLATMASWQPSGQFFDGEGVAPDVELVPRPTDFLTDRGDSVLERALELVESAEVRRIRSERRGPRALTEQNSVTSARGERGSRTRR